MPDTTDALSARQVTRFLRDLRQTRRFRTDPVPDDVLHDLLEVARWTGSSKNSQPWHFLVVREPETLVRLSELGNFTSFVAGSVLAIAIVLDGNSPLAEAYDEGRVQERLMLAAKAHGLGSGTAWYSSEESQRQVRELLGVPEGLMVRSVVAFGYPEAEPHDRPRSVNGGRKPLEELVRYERFDG